MSLKNVQGLITSMILVKFLFFASPIHAQVVETKTSFFPSKSTSNSESNNQSSELFAVQDENVSDSGAPSLRRQPVEGEQRFEPKRIPLRIPRQNYYRSSPSITIINPSGYGAAWGNAGIGIGFQERARFVNEADGVIGFGLV